MPDLQPNGVVCDVCGDPNVVKQLDHARFSEEFCQSCWDKRSNWDTGARYAALRALGHAAMIAKDYGAERWAIYQAVDLAISSPAPERGDDYEGVHPDDAHQLAAHNPIRKVDR